VYKDPKTGRKINVVSPALSLGQAVHNTLEPLRNIAVAERFTRDLLADYDVAWRQISGKVGGFKSEEEEKVVKARGEAMIQRVVANPGPLKNKTVRLKPSHNDMPPNFYLSEEDNIILCGLVDWLEYVEATDSIKILDFKTGKREESEDSLQLPIYLLLLNELQKRPFFQIEVGGSLAKMAEALGLEAKGTDPRWNGARSSWRVSRRFSRSG
jgi:hypothetical protein